MRTHRYFCLLCHVYCSIFALFILWLFVMVSLYIVIVLCITGSARVLIGYTSWLNRLIGDLRNSSVSFRIYSETCLNRTLNKPESCLNRTLNKPESYLNRTLNKPESCLNRTLNKQESCLNRTLNKPESCLNRTLNKPESCLNQTLYNVPM